MKRSAVRLAWVVIAGSMSSALPPPIAAQQLGADSSQELALDAGALAHALDRVGNTGRVLYVAAHPDDENTRLLAYLANGRHLNAAYLSMTRGGGGQNLIGVEQDALLDVIRTQELLAARRLDGAAQRFTRMRDFGYSKSAKETLAIWGEQEALSDVVFVIRAFQPDVIITRFDERPPNHGHHTASAILAREAFSAAADDKRFPEQFELGVRPWQASRLLHNLANWRKEPPPPGAFSVDVGGYDARLGMSYGELAARSRSQHKSQGFGVQGERGELLENFVLLAGSAPAPGADILDGLDLSWERFGGGRFAQAIADARRRLHRDLPERALPALVQAQDALQQLPESPRVSAAKLALGRIIAAASGLFLRATADRPELTVGSAPSLKVEAVMRRPAGLKLRRLRFSDGAVVDANQVLGLNAKAEFKQSVRIAPDAPISAPYWLAQPSRDGHQVIADARWVGDPEGPAPLTVDAEVELEQRGVTVRVPVQYVWTDRVHGERRRTALVVPPATVTPAREAVMFANGKSAPVVLQVRAGGDGLKGVVRLPLPEGWRSVPESAAVELARAGDETTVRFDVTPKAGASAVEIAPQIEVAGTVFHHRLDLIDYPHIPVQAVLQPARLRLSPLSLQLPTGKVGYIEGSGDTIAADLAHVGLRVEVLDEDTLRNGDLSRFGAIVVGIRAYNTRPMLRSVQPRLLRYVEGGGTLLVQYNTTSGQSPLEQQLGPYPLELGRDRVTDQTAEMVAVDPASALLRSPNRLGAADYAGWVQERGLYFGSKWDAKYQPLFKIADPDEPPSLGSVLVARHGKGRYVYTGLSFFRQLPAGVPGAYRLFINLLAH